MTDFAPAPVSIALDVSDLARTLEFYGRVLGFEVVDRQRVGLPFESWVLRSARYPTLALVMRQSYRCPVVGSLPGSLTHLAFLEPAIDEVAARLDSSISVVERDPRSADPGKSLEFYDPNGYLIRLHA